MSEISDAIAEANTEADAAIVRVQDDVAALQAQIAALEAGAVTQADKDNLATLKGKLAALDPVNPATLKK